MRKPTIKNIMKVTFYIYMFPLNKKKVRPGYIELIILIKIIIIKIKIIIIIKNNKKQKKTNKQQNQ
jgi:hypothetical protein